MCSYWFQNIYQFLVFSFLVPEYFDYTVLSLTFLNVEEFSCQGKFIFNIFPLHQIDYYQLAYGSLRCPEPTKAGLVCSV